MKYSVGDMFAIKDSWNRILFHWVIAETHMYLGNEVYKVYNLQENNFDWTYANTIDNSPSQYVPVLSDETELT